MVTVVTGPPCGGKTTHIETHAKAGDVVIDLDDLATALTTDHHHITPAVLTVARAARRAALDAALALDADVWLIDSAPTPRDRQRYTDHGARFIHCEPDRFTLNQRADARGNGAHAAIAEYYARTQRAAAAAPLAW
jgi:hypothetical protein